MKCGNAAGPSGIIAEMLKVACEGWVAQAGEMTCFSCGVIPVEWDFGYVFAPLTSLSWLANCRSSSSLTNGSTLHISWPWESVWVACFEGLWWVSRSLCVEEEIVHVIQWMYANVRSQVRLIGHNIQVFGVEIGLYQCPVLSPLLHFLVQGSLLGDIRSCVPWKLLYTDYPLHIEDTHGECLSKPNAGKAGMENKGLRVNMLKKVFGLWCWPRCPKKSSKYPCAVCFNNVGRISWCARNESCGSTRSRVASHETVGGWLQLGPPLLSPLTAELWLKWMSTAPCLMWRPLSATSVAYCTLVGAVTVPLPPDVAWPGEISGNSCLS